MNAPESPEKRIEIIYKYFSHHIRTNTAVIVAMLEVINEGMSDESMTEMVMESGCLLDLFDRGMGVCFNHLFGKEEKSQPEDIELHMLVELFVNNAVTKDGSCNVDIDIPADLTVRCEPYSFKSLVQIFLHESALAAVSGFRVSFKDNQLEISPDEGYYDNPPAFAVFKELLGKQGIVTEYDKKFIKLRFPYESINSR